MERPAGELFELRVFGIFGLGLTRVCFLRAGVCRANPSPLLSQQHRRKSLAVWPTRTHRGAPRLRTRATHRFPLMCHTRM